MNDPIMQKLDAMQARCDAATEGPWAVEFAGDFGDQSAVILCARWRGMLNTAGFGEDVDTAQFVAHARTDMPRIIDALKAVLAGHRPVTYSFSWTEGVQMHEVCPTCYDKAGVHECGCWREEDEDDHQCAVCSMPEVKGGKVSWPCMTVTTIQTALGVDDD